MCQPFYVQKGVNLVFDSSFCCFSGFIWSMLFFNNLWSSPKWQIMQENFFFEVWKKLESDSELADFENKQSVISTTDIT